MVKRRIHKVIYQKLRKDWGKAEDSTIYIDSRTKGIKHLEILCHEAMHILLPHLAEEEVEHIGAELSICLWNQGYRRTDGDTSGILQDGRKVNSKK